MKRISMDAFLNFRFLGNLKSSPEETRFAFLAAQANLDKNAYHHTLYIGDTSRVDKLMKLKKNQDFLFLNEDRLLLNYQKNKKEEKALKEASQQSYYSYDLSTKSLDKAFDMPFPAKLEALIDEHTLLISATMLKEDHILYEGDEDARKAYLKEKKKDSAYEDIDEIPYYFNGMDFTANKKKQLFFYDIVANKVTPVFDQSFSMGHYLLSEDKKTLYYTGKTDEKVMSMTSKIYAYDIETKTHQTLYDKTDYDIVKMVEVGDELLVVAKDFKDHGLNQNPDFYLLQDGALNLLAKYRQSFGNTMGTDARLLGSESTFVKDDQFYFVATIDDHNDLKTVDLNGNIKTVYTMDGAINGVLLLKDDIFMIAMHKQRLEELYRYDFDKNNISMMTRLNSRVLSNHYVAKPKKVVVKKDNHEVKGFVLLPKDYDPKQSYPAILDIHGGPKTIYGQIYYHEMQYWANEGYLVFFANPRGSDGKGDDFADIRGKYGTIDYDDLMDFTDRVLKKYPAIDQKRLFVTGGSYGGFMTNWMVSHTDRFKAAATQRSISNWLSFYGTSDIGYFFASDQTDGHPLRDLNKLYEQSPIKYALNIKTPLLFIHSDKDHRCPMEQAQQLYAVLKTEGLDTKLVWFKGENHGLSRGGKPHARLKRLNEITEWFNKYNA